MSPPSRVRHGTGTGSHGCVPPVPHPAPAQPTRHRRIGDTCGAPFGYQAIDAVVREERVEVGHGSRVDAGCVGHPGARLRNTPCGPKGRANPAWGGSPRSHARHARARTAPSAAKRRHAGVAPSALSHHHGWNLGAPTIPGAAAPGLCRPALRAAVNGPNSAAGRLTKQRETNAIHGVPISALTPPSPSPAASPPASWQYQHPSVSDDAKSLSPHSTNAVNRNTPPAAACTHAPVPK